MKDRRIKKLLLFLFLVSSIFILTSSSVYARISIHPAGCSYGNQSCGAEIANCDIDGCPKTDKNCPSKCEVDLESCEYEGRYDMTFWIHGSLKTRTGIYYVDYDDDEEFCQEPLCGNGKWNDGADMGNGECCGDDIGIYVNEWSVVVTIDEEDIPAFQEIRGSEKVNFAYAGTSQQQASGEFEIPKNQTASWQFIIKGCWLYNTEMYAMIKDSSGASVAGEDGDYIFHMDSNEPCSGNYIYSGKFDVVIDETYTLEIYKGNTDVPSDEGLGFEDMSLEVTFIDYSDETRTDTLKFVQKINSNSTITFDLIPESNGTLNIYSIKRYIVPGSSAYITDFNTRNVKAGEQIEEKITVGVIDHEIGGDCAIVYSGDICFDTYNYEFASQGRSYWDWLNAGGSGIQGGIIDIECYGVSAVSDGWNWHLCKYPNSLTEEGSVSQPITTPANEYFEFTKPRLNIGGNHFLCYDDGIKPRIKECVGEGEPLSSISADYSPESILKTGESEQTADKTYYCTTYSELQTDLDNVDEFGDTEGKSCTEATAEDGESLKWTGSLCCGEADDGKEYYNDIDGNGGCWKSERVSKETLVEEDGMEIKEVINYKGEFLGCAIAANAQYTGKGYFLELQDLHTQGQLITDKEACTVLQGALGGNAYCNYWGEWKETTESNLSLRTNPFTGGSGCCPPGKCWDGTIDCAANKIDDSDMNTFEGYRCYDGEWVDVQLKESWDKESLGFCPRDDQCLVTMEGSAGNNDNPETFYTNILTSKPKCIADKDYFLDSYCENGKWTSRTKQIASAMIDMANKQGITDFTLYCDDYEKVLPEYRDILAVQCNRDGYNVPCINNICMLTYEDEIIIGTSYNMPINSSYLTNNPLAGLCEDVRESEEGNPSGKFVACTRKVGSSSEVWYNYNIESIIFNKGALIDVSISNENWFNLFVPLLKGAMDSVLDWIIRWNPQTLVYGEPHHMVVEFINSTQDFDKIYISHVGSKHVMATYGKAIDYDLPIAANPLNFIALTYEGFDTGDLCQYAGRFQNDYGESVACNKSGNNYYIFSKYDIWMQIWQDLTSKLRLSADTVDSCVDECTIFGIKECGAGQEYRECGQYDPDSCIEWSQYLPLDCSDYCNPDTNTKYYNGVCSGGECAYSTQACEFGCLDDACKICEDECPYYSAKNCIDDTHYGMCLYHDADDCLEWGGSYELLCPDYCSDTECFRQGSCSIGECNYEQVISCVCDNTCNPDCDSDPDCSCTDDDSCCGAGCYAHTDNDCIDVNPCTLDDAELPCQLDS